MINMNGPMNSETGFGTNEKEMDKTWDDLDGEDFAENSRDRQDEEITKINAAEEKEYKELYGEEDDVDIQQQNINAANEAQEEDAPDIANEA